MPNIKLVIEYNGERFHGWQEQPEVRTIQVELHRTLELILRQKIHHVQASGRTDEGVHARAQVVNFKIESEPDLVLLKRSVSSLLKGELSVLSAEVVSDGFNALRDAEAKTYRYTIYNNDVPPVLDRGFVWLNHRKLDLDIMKREAAELLGRQDFKCFQGSGCAARGTEKEIFESVITEQQPYIYYTITGSGFLKHMVRNIVGSLVAFGMGTAKTSSMRELVSLKNRQLAGVTAPPWGLCLMKVWYEKPNFSDLEQCCTPIE